MIMGKGSIAYFIKEENFFKKEVVVDSLWNVALSHYSNMKIEEGAWPPPSLGHHLHLFCC